MVANPGRLQILTALAVEERQEFVSLRKRTKLTDGNLAAHAKRLQSAGLINIDKQFRDGRPVTSFVLTGSGRLALETHVRRLMSALSHRRLAPSVAAQTDSPNAVATMENDLEPPTRSNAPLETEPHEEEWVD